MTFIAPPSLITSFKWMVENAEHWVVGRKIDGSTTNSLQTFAGHCFSGTPNWHSWGDGVWVPYHGNPRRAEWTLKTSFQRAATGWMFILLLKISPRIPQDFHKISTRFPQDFPKISPRFLQDFPKISPRIGLVSTRFSQDFYKISPRILQDFP